jgi:hypothetical protein
MRRVTEKPRGGFEWQRRDKRSKRVFNRFDATIEWFLEPTLLKTEKYSGFVSMGVELRKADGEVVRSFLCAPLGVMAMLKAAESYFQGKTVEVQRDTIARPHDPGAFYISYTMRWPVWQGAKANG